MERFEAELAAEIEALLADAEATTPPRTSAFGADRRGDELPEELARRERRLARICEANAALEAEAAEAERARRDEMAGGALGAQSGSAGPRRRARCGDRAS